MATGVEVMHPDPVIRDLALEYMAGIEAAIARRFGSYLTEVTVHDGQISDVRDELTSKKRLTKPKARP